MQLHVHLIRKPWYLMTAFASTAEYKSEPHLQVVRVALWS